MHRSRRRINRKNDRDKTNVKQQQAGGYYSVRNVEGGRWEARHEYTATGDGSASMAFSLSLISLPSS
ncbi:hypothetical protein E2C01_085349 [Portunus trituberculatus]|uniref:Uncharacterized protein n=1 Tax=Portunus trituberculatus TaxID=210409 RepID=A0A5B7JBP5_PORTR|nr:hypothetical protein [Portunus trituberculatus]